MNPNDNSSLQTVDPVYVEILAALHSLQLLHYLVLSSFVVLVYDHILTIKDEVQYVWKHRWTPFSILFLVNRYFALPTITAYLWLTLGFGQDGGENLAVVTFGGSKRTHEILTALSPVVMLIAEAILALRVHAIYRTSKPILGLVLLVWVTHLVAICIGLFEDNFVLEVDDTVPLFSLTRVSKFLLIVPSIIFDMIVGVLLTAGLYRKSGYKTPLIRLIMRDGTLYLAVVLLSNIVWVIVGTIPDDFGVFEIQFTVLEIWSAW
ncbi:hypothetical protein BDZ94DRAFT_1314628 [Collybia nuda]|uniref:DUF6533 domain-containing protein n=1 Tax=Collybia nuda TaxID=64659 RepID=A0A9P6CCB9_9AGAR|nr:hypothetical protein BDZ94DRAFT_1314628 [Collybia nuda]